MMIMLGIWGVLTQPSYTLLFTDSLHKAARSASGYQRRQNILFCSSFSTVFGVGWGIQDKAVVKFVAIEKNSSILIIQVRVCVRDGK
jgi:hypothetical protein